MTVADDHGFETLDALLDGPFAICSIITDDDGTPSDYRFLRVSRCFEESTGFRGAEGRTVRELVPDLERTWIELCGRVALDRVPAQFTEGSALTGHEYEVRAAPLEPPGRFVVTFRDLTKARRREASGAQAGEHAQHLLKELGHRVMNSFAAISAIVAMEARAAPPGGRAGLDRVQGRVQALASLYRRLDGAPQVDRVEVADYLGGIVASLRDSLATAGGVAVEAGFQPMTLPTRVAVPLGLVVNELLTDAVMRAFETGRSGTVRVSLDEVEGTCRLRLSRDGDEVQEPAGTGIGQSLVAAFVGELGGELTTEAGRQGSSVTVTFKAPQGEPGGTR